MKSAAAGHKAANFFVLSIGAARGRSDLVEQATLGRKRRVSSSTEENKGRVAQSRKHEARLASTRYMGVFAAEIKRNARKVALRFPRGSCFQPVYQTLRRLPRRGW